jgi:hypothetical protein
MLPALANLPDAYRGDTYGPIVFEFFDVDDNPIDVSGAVVKCEVGTRENKREIVLKWPDNTHNVLLSSNMVALEQVPFDKMKMHPGIYFYDLEITINGYTRSYLRGNLTVIDEVTNY